MLRQLAACTTGQEAVPLDGVVGLDAIMTALHNANGDRFHENKNINDYTQATLRAWGTACGL